VFLPDATLQLEKLEVFDTFLVVWVRRNGLRVFYFSSINANGPVGAWMEGPQWDQANFSYMVHPSLTWSFESRIYRSFSSSSLSFVNSTLTQPIQKWEFNLKNKETTLVEGGGASDLPYRIVRKRVWIAPDLRVVSAPPPSFLASPAATAQVYVPVDVAFRSQTATYDAEAGPNAELLLPAIKTAVLFQSWGSGGEINDVYYHPQLIYLLQMGVAVAWIHPRGDGDLGPAWSKAGQQNSKTNAFLDTSAVMNSLIRNGFADENRLGLRTRSDGGTFGLHFDHRATTFFNLTYLLVRCRYHCWSCVDLLNSKECGFLCGIPDFGVHRHSRLEILPQFSLHHGRRCSNGSGRQNDDLP
jgi:oligopeptidase B